MRSFYEKHYLKSHNYDLELSIVNVVRGVDQFGDPLEDNLVSFYLNNNLVFFCHM